MNSDEIYRRIPSIASPLKRQLMTVALISRMLQERGSRPPLIICGCEKRRTAPENDTVQELNAIRERIRNEKG